MLVAECCKAAAGGGGAADVVDENVQASPFGQDFVPEFFRAGAGGDVFLHKQRRSLAGRKRRARGGADACTGEREAANDGFAHAFGAAGHKDSLLLELVAINGEGIVGRHGLISSDVIWSFSSVKV